MKASFRALLIPIALPFLAVLVPHAARAQGAPVGERAAPALQWTAPAYCPSEAAINEELAALTGHPETAEGANSAAATVTPSRSRAPGEGLDVEVRFPGRAPRRFHAATCREAASATALIVALTFHPGVPLAVPPAPPEPTPPEPTPPEPTPPEKPPVTPPEKPAEEAPPETPETPRGARSAPSPPRFQLAAFAGATIDAGTLPGPTPGVAVGLALGAPHHLRVAASVATFLDQERGTPNGAVAAFSLLSVQLRGCWELPFAGRFTAGPCLGGRFAHVSPNLFGDGVRTGNRGRSPDGASLFGLGGGGHVAVRLSPVFAVGGDLAVDGWLTHPQFLVVDPVTGAGTAVHGVPKASFFGALSVEGRFL